MTSGLLLLGGLVLLVFLGIPMAYAIGAASTLYLVITDMKPLILVAQRIFIGMDSFVLIAIPLYTLSGYLMDSGGLSKRLVNCIERYCGNVPGSMGTVAIICCTIFAALTGSGPATVAAIGAVMLPIMLQNGYTRQESAGVLAAGGALGPIIPPSIVMIVYGCTMNLSVPKMFVAAIIPGLIMALSLIMTNTVMAVRKQKRQPVEREKVRYGARERLYYTWKALGVIFLPVIVLGGIYGGIFTPTEASVVCVVYSLILGLCFKELNREKLLSALRKTVETSAGILMIVGISNIFGWILSAAKIPALIADSIVPYLRSPALYIAIVLLLLFFAGCFMETLSSVVIFAPILVPIGIALGIDQLHLGVVFCIALVVGFITPPFGVNIFTVTGVANVNFAQAVRGVLPYMLVLVLCVILFAYVPEVVLWLPGLAPTA